MNSVDLRLSGREVEGVRGEGRGREEGKEKGGRGKGREGKGE